jgi:3-isopropylmalate/(R)-2-methylmalate dehydratase small subunit
MEAHLRGRVWILGDSVDTDQLCPGRYLGIMDPKVWAEHCLEATYPRFNKEAGAGDIVVAGRNFGCGSSREHAAQALMTRGLSCVVADSFARIFYRNSINIGLPVVECPGASRATKEGEVLEVDMGEGFLRTQGGQVLKFKPLPPNILAILQAGGLVKKLRAELAGR